MTSAVLDRTGSEMPQAHPATPWYRSRKLDQWICFWSIPIFYNLFGMIFVPLSWIMPPRSPTASVEVVLAFMQYPALPLAAVILVLTLGIAAMANAVIVVQMRRMQGVSPVLGYGYLGALALGAISGCLFPMLVFAAGAFRPDANPELVVMLYEMGFLFFVGSLGCFCTQYLMFAIAIFLDRRGIFPRWLGYFTIWGYVTELLAAACWMTDTGPFAWDGLLTFYLGTLIFVGWEFCLCVCLYRAIRDQPEEELDNARY